MVGAVSWAGPTSGMSMEEAALGELPSAIMITPPNGRAVSMDPSLLWDARATELAAKVSRRFPRATAAKDLQANAPSRMVGAS